MKKVLQIVAHPDHSERSFTHTLASNFAAGIRSSGHEVSVIKLMQDGIPKDFEDQVLEADHLCFAWPCWWEMPPAELVNLFQTVFVQGFAFDFNGERMVPKLDLDVTCIISMGQQKNANTNYLVEAMSYCGLHPSFLVYKNVGPRLEKEQAEIYLQHIYNHGNKLFKYD